MTERPQTRALLLALPRSDAAGFLEAVVVEEFKTSLLMPPEEELPLDAGFFDELGLTSLRLTEIKRRLEDRLGCDISANVVFNRPSVRQLVAYLAGLVLPEGSIDEPAAPGPPVPGDVATKALLDDVLEDLYRA